MTKINPKAWDRLTASLNQYEPLIKNLRKTANADWLHGTPEGDLLRNAADALADLAANMAFRTGFLMGLASKYGESLDNFAGDPDDC